MRTTVGDIFLYFPIKAVEDVTPAISKPIGSGHFLDQSQHLLVIVKHEQAVGLAGAKLQDGSFRDARIDVAITHMISLVKRFRTLLIFVIVVNIYYNYLNYTIYIPPNKAHAKTTVSIGASDSILKMGLYAISLSPCIRHLVNKLQSATCS